MGSTLRAILSVFAGMAALAVACTAQAQRVFEGGEDCVAVVVSNQTYTTRGVPPVEFAHRDAEAVIEWLRAIDCRNVTHLRDASLDQLNAWFGTRERPEGRLFNAVRPGRSNVFVYYSGHGAPDRHGPADQRDGHLIPVGVDPDEAHLGYSMSVLESNLNGVRNRVGPDRAVLMVIDACFTGRSDGGAIQQRETSGGPNFVPTLPRPAPNFLRITATRADQVAHWDRANRLSLLTARFLMAVNGLGPAPDTRGLIGWGPLTAWLGETVARDARAIANRSQQPEFTPANATIALPVRPTAMMAPMRARAQDAQNFSAATEANTIVDYEVYIARCRQPGAYCRHADEAEQRRRTLREVAERQRDEQLWRQLSPERRFSDYLAQCAPTCLFGDRARDEIARAEATRDAQRWSELSQRRLFDEYLRSCQPVCAFAGEARRRLDEERASTERDRDRRLWAELAPQGRFEEYLNRCSPICANAREAQQRVADERAARERDGRLWAEHSAQRRFQAYLDRCAPICAFGVEARRLLAEEQGARERDQRLWAELSARRAFQDYLDRCAPVCGFTMEARRALGEEQAARQRDQRLWEELSGQRRFQAYLDQCAPNCGFADAARSALRDQIWVVCNSQSRISNLRPGPSAQSVPILRALPNYTELRVLRETPSPVSGHPWYEVELNDGARTRGFIDSNSVALQCDLTRPDGGAEAAGGPLGQLFTSFWYLNQSQIGMRQNGGHFSLVYIDPRPGLRAVGVANGDTLFVGRRQGQLLTGRATTFSANCPDRQYDVQGTISADERTISLSGMAPFYVGGNCNRVVYQPRDMTIRFDRPGP